MSELLAKYDNVELGDISLVSDFIARILSSNSVVLLYGDLGSGKTTLCSSIIKTFLSKEKRNKEKEQFTKVEDSNTKNEARVYFRETEFMESKMQKKKLLQDALHNGLKDNFSNEPQDWLKNQQKYDFGGNSKDQFEKDRLEVESIDKIDITSPTFNILHTYKFNDLALVNHYDLYRLKSIQELMELGFLDSLINNVTLIEWPKFLRDFFIDNNIMENIFEVYIDYKENSRDFLIKKLSKN